MINSKLSLCKKLQYQILNNKKLDWLKREKGEKLDSIDLLLGLLFLSMLILANIFGAVLVLPMLLLGYSLMLMFQVRQIKSVPEDIESSFMSPCLAIAFLMILLIIAIVITLGKLI